MPKAMLLAKKIQTMEIIMSASMTATLIPANKQQTTVLATTTEMRMAMRKSSNWTMVKKNQFETKHSIYER